MRRRWIMVALAAVAAVVVAVVVASGGGGRGSKVGTAPPGKRLPAATTPSRTPAEARKPAPRGLEIALQDDAVLTHRYYYDSATALRQARQLGVSWLRVNVLWSAAAGSSARSSAPPAQVAWDWGQYDRVVNDALAAGLHVELSLTGPAPAWATADHAVGPVRPDAGQYRRFVSAAAEHFRGRVSRYSIWNEPNFITWLRPLGAAPSIYRQLFEAGYGAIKAVDSRAAVLIGETAAYAKPGTAMAPLEFLRALACQGCPRLIADGYAHHPYDFTEAPEAVYPGSDNVTIGTLDRLTNALDELARAGRLSDARGRPLDVYLTEFGYLARGRRALPVALRAAYLTRAFAIAQRHYPRVRQMLQYLLVGPPPGFPGGQFDTSLITNGGAITPAYTALATWSAREVRRGRVLPPGPPAR